MTEPQLISFQYELQCLLNGYSMENDSNTPDFILAMYLHECLKAFNLAIIIRESSYGRIPNVGSLTVNNMRKILVTTNPTYAQLIKWWDAMQSDDLSVAFSDAFPSTLHDFCTQLDRGEKILFMCLYNGEVAGAMWLYSLELDTVKPEWVGVYILPAYRNGLLKVDMAKECIKEARQRGIEHVYAAIHTKNIASQLYTESVGFTYACTVPNFSLFNKWYADSHIYALKEEDINAAMDISREHARRISNK